jgi:hypothetical protein
MMGMGMMGMGMPGMGLGDNNVFGFNKPEFVLPVGTSIVLIGNDIPQNLVGKLGTIFDYDRGSSQYIVTVDNIGPDNMKLVPSHCIQQMGVEAHVMNTGVPEIDGKLGQVMSFDESRLEYLVAVGNRTVVVPCTSVVFPPGTLLRIHGLPTNPYRNKWVKVLVLDEQNCGFKVELPNGNCAVAKPCNLRI